VVVQCFLSVRRWRDRLNGRRAAALAVGGFLAAAVKLRKLPGVRLDVLLDETEPLDDHEPANLQSRIVGPDGDDGPRGNGGTTVAVDDRRGSGNSNSSSSSSSSNSKTKTPKVHSQFTGTDGSSGPHDPFSFDPSRVWRYWRSGRYGGVYDDGDDLLNAAGPHLETFIFEDTPWNS
jgi:hypothetical protein